MTALEQEPPGARSGEPLVVLDHVDKWFGQLLAPGLTYVGDQIYGEFRNQVPTVIVVAALYIAANMVLTVIATFLQRRFVGEKKPLEVPMVGAEGGAGPPPARL